MKETRVWLIALSCFSTAYGSLPQSDARPQTESSVSPTFTLSSTASPSNAHIVQENKVLNIGEYGVQQHGSLEARKVAVPWESRTNYSSNADAAYHNWELYRATEPPEFWERSPDTIKAAKVFDFVKDFALDYNTKDSMGCKSRKTPYGPIPCFAWYYAGDADFKCHIDSPDMCAHHSSRQIMEHVESTWKAKPLEERVDLGRQIYLSLEIIKILLNNDHIAWNIMQVVRGEISSEAPKLVKTFTPQINNMDKSKCELTKDMIEMGVQLGLSFASCVGSSAISGALARSVKMAELFQKLEASTIIEDLTEEGIRRAGDKVFNAAFMDSMKGNMPFFGSSVVSAGEQAGKATQKYLDSFPDDNPHQALARRLNLVQTMATGMCGNNFGVVVDDNEVHIGKVVDFLLEYTDDVLTDMQTYFQAMFKYNKTEGTTFANSTLDAFKYLTLLPQTEVEDDWTAQKEHVKSLVFRMLSGMLLTETRSHIVCEEFPPDQIEKICKEQLQHVSKFSQQSRTCVPHLNLRCQAGRLTKQGYLNHVTFMPGIEDGSWAKFQKYNLTPEAVINGSLARWQRDRENAFDFQGILENNTFLNPDELSRIPVCEVSPTLKVIENMDKGQPWRHHISFQCGDYKGNETEEFFREINVDVLHEHEIWFQLFAEYLNREPDPITGYLATCNQKVRWPEKKRPLAWLVRNQTESHCEQVKSEIMFMPERDEANYHFCTMPDMQDTFNSDHDYLVNILKGPKNFKAKCKDWMNEHKECIDAIAKRSTEQFNMVDVAYKALNMTNPWPVTEEERNKLNAQKAAEAKRIQDEEAAEARRKKDCKRKKGGKKKNTTKEDVSKCSVVPATASDLALQLLPTDLNPTRSDISPQPSQGPSADGKGIQGTAENIDARHHVSENPSSPV